MFKVGVKANVHLLPKKPWGKIIFNMIAMSRYPIIAIPVRKMDSN